MSKFSKQFEEVLNANFVKLEKLNNSLSWALDLYAETSDPAFKRHADVASKLIEELGS